MADPMLPSPINPIFMFHPPFFAIIIMTIYSELWRENSRASRHVGARSSSNEFGIEVGEKKMAFWRPLLSLT